MRKVIVTLLILITYYTMNAQAVKTSNSTIKIDGKERPAISITSEAEVKPLQKAWRKYLKKKYKVKTDKSRSAVTGNAITINDVSDRQFDLHTIFNATPEGCEMLNAAAPGYDIYFSPNEYQEDYNKLKTLAENFVKNYMKAEYASLVKEKKKAVARSESDEKLMAKETRKLEKRIEKDKKKMRKLQKNIDKNSATVENNKKELPKLKTIAEEKRQILKAIEQKQKEIGK